MKTLIAIAVLWMVLVRAEAAPEVVRAFDWGAEVSSGRISVSGVSTGLVSGRTVLRVVNDRAEPLQVRLLSVVDPGVTQRVYAVTAEIRYEGVEGEGYLEMWSSFPSATAGGPEASYFSRTLGQSGPMGRLAGRSDWRRMELKFDRTGASAPPYRLEVFLHLAGRGVVDLGPMQLVAFGNGAGLAIGGDQDGAWWSSRTAGWIGGGLGSLWGVFGAVAGVLCGRGCGRSFVVWGFVVMLGMGVLLTLSGIVAAVLGQPAAVWFSLFLPGILAVGLGPGQLGFVRRRYADLEMRRMLAADLETQL